MINVVFSQWYKSIKKKLGFGFTSLHIEEDFE